MKQKALHLDFETRSTVDLKKFGANVYAKDSSTEVMCMAYAFENAPVNLWVMGDDSKIFEDIYWSVIKQNYQIYAHNAPFEMAIWNHTVTRHFDVPKIPIAKFECSMAKAFAMSLPGSLDGAASALGVTEKKDAEGHRVMMQLSQPKPQWKKGNSKDMWWDNDAKYQKLFAYCKQDVVVERELSKRLLSLSHAERRVWELDQKINQRGIKIDVPAAKAASEVVEVATLAANAEIQRITSGYVAACSETKRLTEWIRDQGVPVEGVAKEHCEKMLRKFKTPGHVKEAAAVRLATAKTSTAKLVSFIKNAEEDERVRNLFQYHGASTGRWAGRRIQPHNMPRPAIKQDEIEAVFEILNDSTSTPADKTATIDIMHGAPLGVISDCLRGFLTAGPGKELIALDYNAIEARTLAWLADEKNVLNMFKQDLCVYSANATSIYNLPIEKISEEMRFVGKVAELALGYEGGYKAFRAMAKGYGLTSITDKMAEQIKNAWRAKRQKTVNFWKQMEETAIKAIANPRTKFDAGTPGRKISFIKNGSFLWCQLPSRRVLCYPFPNIMEIETPGGDLKNSVTYMGVKGFTRKWERISSYGGKLTENINQAVARDILANSLLELDNEDMNPVIHVHDEVVIEEDKDKYSMDRVENIVSRLPIWAAELPIKAKGWKGFRYRK